MGNAGKLCRIHGYIRFFESLAHSLEIFNGGGDLVVIFNGLHIIGTGIDDQFHKVVFAFSLGFNGDESFFLEHPPHTAVFTEVSAGFTEGGPNFADGAVFVVGHRFQKDGRSSGTVSFIGDLFIVYAFQLASTFFNGASDVVDRHVFAFGDQDGGSKARVASGVSATDASRHSDFLNELGENFSAFGVGRALFMFYTGPLGMTGHNRSLCKKNY